MSWDDYLVASRGFIKNEITSLKGWFMSELDDATNRIVADVDSAVAAIASLRTAIADAANAGADTAALTAAADKLEAALAPPAP
jgi:hypothetical protein